MEITTDEIMVICIARQIRNGDTVVQGLATPLVATAYLLARMTHAPDLYYASAIGQSVCRRPAPLGLTRVESLWLDRSLTRTSFVNVATEILPRLRPKEFFRPAQVDPYGNFNNIALGDDYHRPRLRLPGAGGIPDVTTFIDQTHLYVPRHSRITFVPKVDFIAGMGYSPSRTHGIGPRYLVSDMGQFDFADGIMRLISYHPGVEIEKIQARTGFPLQIAPDIHETPLPHHDELHLLRQEIDPLGIRRLESLGGAARRQLLHEIILIEAGKSLGSV